MFIIGGGKIAYYLAKQLSQGGVSVKIMENNEERCQELCQELDNVTVLCGDGTDHNVLLEEGISNSDACVTLTGIDEENVIISLFIKMQNVSKVVTKVDRLLIAEMVKQFGLDTLISPKSVIANQIVRFVRENQVKAGDGINTLYMLNDKVEALEFTVKPTFEKINVPLKNMHIKKNVLIGGIVREEEFITPSGDTILLPNDRVIVVCAEKHVNELKDILA